MYYVSERDSGELLEETDSVERAFEIIGELENEDRTSGLFVEDYYDIINEFSVSLVKELL